MIEKMQFLSITGPKDDMDRAIEQHLSKYDFQLESTMTELSETTGLKPFIEINPYRETLNKLHSLCPQWEQRKQRRIVLWMSRGCSFN